MKVAPAAEPIPFQGIVRLGMRLQLTAASAAGVAVEIFDVRGRRVRRARTAPDGTWAWDGRDAAGARLAAGVYWLRVPRAGTVARTHKLVWRAR
jgi:hypothetical protein